MNSRAGQQGKSTDSCPEIREFSEELQKKLCKVCHLTSNLLPHYLEKFEYSTLQL